MVRTQGSGERIYANTDTSMPMVNLSLENLGQATERHYALVRYQGSSEPRVSLLRWMGKPKLAEEVTT